MRGGRSRALARVVASLIALVAWLAAAIQIILTAKHAIGEGFSAAFGVVRALGYFTILTNLLIGVVATALSRRGESDAFPTRPSTVSAVTVSITIVGAIYSFLLRGLWEPTGLQLWVDVALHDVVPILFVLYWLRFVTKGTLTWSMPLRWLAYPLGYVVWTLARGAVTSDYPYPFADPGLLGYGRVAVNTLAILGAFCAVGYLVVGVDKLMAAHNSSAEAL